MWFSLVSVLFCLVRVFWFCFFWLFSFVVVVIVFVFYLVLGFVLFWVFFCTRENNLALGSVCVCTAVTLEIRINLES